MNAYFYNYNMYAYIQQYMNMNAYFYNNIMYACIQQYRII